MALFSRNRGRPKPGPKDFNEGIYHRPPVGLSFFKTGVLALILILVLSYFAYTKKLPWADEGYTATATFADPLTLRETAPVRIAGVNVGKVTEVESNGEASEVTFTVDEDGLPLNEDATVTIRPRLFLEGNYFLDLRPGSPSAENLADEGDIPMTQTAVAVKLDEVLTALQAPDRENLQKLLRGYGGALADQPTPEEDVGQDPDVQGKSAAEAINESFRYGGRAGKGSSQVSRALLGTEAGDLRGLVSSSADVFGELASRESELSELITNFNVATGAFADESANLEETLSELAPTVEQAQTQLVKINSTFPPLRAFARELTPGVRELPATIEAGTPWLIQADRLLQPDELGGIANDLAIATPTLARGTANLGGLFDELGLLSRCASNVARPGGRPGHQRPVLDRLDQLRGVPLRPRRQLGRDRQLRRQRRAAADPDRRRPGQGQHADPVRQRQRVRPRQRQLRQHDPGADRHAAAEALVEAADPHRRPLLHPGRAGRQRAAGDGRRPQPGGLRDLRTMRKALRTYTKDFVALIVLTVIGIAILFVILSQQASALPSWFPFLGEDRFELKTELQTAQAVTPGQGQTVNLSGVKVGDVTEVELEDGVAVVTMQVENEYAPLIHEDASALLRPRTGLQDMVIEVDPGTTDAASVDEGHVIPLANSEPNVNFDSILASLDGDTRAYLKLLLSGGAEALGTEKKSREFSAVLRRLEPTTRDLAKINGAVAKRRENLGPGGDELQADRRGARPLRHRTSPSSSRPRTPSSAPSPTPSSRSARRSSASPPPCARPEAPCRPPPTSPAR